MAMCRFCKEEFEKMEAELEELRERLRLQKEVIKQARELHKISYFPEGFTNQLKQLDHAVVDLNEYEHEFQESKFRQ